MILEYLLEYVLFTITVLAVWKGKDVFKYIKQPKCRMKFVLSLVILLVLTLIKREIPNFYLSTIFTSLNIIIIFNVVWKLDMRMSVISSLSAIIIVLFSDLVGYSLMVIIHANFKYAPYYFLLSRFIHALLIAPIVHIKFKNKNPLLLIGWKDLTCRVKNRLILGMFLITGSLFFNMTLIHKSKVTENLRAHSGLFIFLTMLSFGIFILAICVIFRYKPSGTKKSVDYIEVRNVLLYYNKVYDLKAYIDSSLSEYKEIDYSYLLDIIEKIDKKKLKMLSIKIFKGYDGILTMLNFKGWINVPDEVKDDVDNLIEQHEVTLEYDELTESLSINILEHK